MHSSLIGKIEKARRYAEEPQRVRIKHLAATFRGDHSEYEVAYNQSGWHCTCDFFDTYGTCSHTMALQRNLEGMAFSQA